MLFVICLGVCSNVNAGCLFQQHLKRDLFQRLLSKVFQVMQRLPLDVDYLKFVVNQEMVLFRSLSGQVEMPQDVMNALTQLWTHINIEHSNNLTPSHVPVLQ